MTLAPLRWAGGIGTIAAMLIAASVGKGLFDGCIYAAIHDIAPGPARATAVGLMTMLGFIGAGLTPPVGARSIIVAA